MGILDAPARPGQRRSYDPATRPWYLDFAWRICHGNGFDQIASINSTTLASSPAQYATGFDLTNSAGLAVGEPYVVGSGAASEVVTIQGLSGNTVTLSFPKLLAAHSSGESCGQFWTNDTHPTARGFEALAYFVANAKQRLALTGVNLLSNGHMPSTYTDVNAVATVPLGWESIGAFTPGATAYVANSVLKAARRGAGASFITASGVAAGYREMASIPVSPGVDYTVLATAKSTSNFGELSVIDKATGTVLASQLVGNNSAGGANQWQILGLVAISFTAPNGCSDVEVRFLGTTAGATTAYLDDVRVLRARQSATDDRYVIEDPGTSPIVVLGDSWTVGAMTTNPYLQAALAARLPNAKVINAGITGQRMDQMVARFATDVAAYRPAYVIHFSGWANDLSAGRTQAQMEADADAFIAACRSIGAIPVFLGVMPLGSAESTSNDRNDQIRARCDVVTV